MDEFIVRVKSGDKEIEVKIPLGNRSTIGMGRDGTGKAAIDVVKEIIEQIKKMP